MRNEQLIQSFLHYGYLPRLLEDVHEQTRAKLDTPPEKLPDGRELIQCGVRALKAAFANPWGTATWCH